MAQLKSNFPSAPGKSGVDAVLKTAVTAGNTLISVVSGLLASFLILFSGYVLYDTFYTQNAAFTNSWELLKYKPEIIEDGVSPLSGTDTLLASKLAAINKDYRAWLTLYDTLIDYPVLQGPNDLYYASHDVFGNTSLTGSIYLAASNGPDLSDNYNLIYGHHMDNGAMFGALDKYGEADYFQSYRDGILITHNRLLDLHVFAAIDTDAYEAKIYRVGTRNLTEILDYAETTARQIDAADVAALREEIENGGSPQIVALSTCRDATTSGRFVVLATMTARERVVVNADNVHAVYDAQTHTYEASVSIEDGTKVEYSTDGGRTWSEDPPTYRNAGETTIYVRATNSIYGTSTSVVTVTVDPAPVTVRADDLSKVYSQSDPTLTATVTGVLDDFRIDYTVVRQGVGDDETVGTYDDAIVVTGEERQGNYIVTYETGSFTIEKSSGLTVTGTDTIGVYDGQPHSVPATVNVPGNDTTVVYSTDGGVTWTPDPPSFTNAGEYTVIVRASNPNYYDSEDEITVTITRREAVVTASNLSKIYGDEDPVLTATVSGVIDGAEIEYTISRPGAGSDENVGGYAGAIIPSGKAEQGNYTVRYVAGDFTVTPANDLTLSLDVFDGVYDGQPHSVIGTPNIPEGTTVEYSTDGGTTWTTTPPELKDVGELPVIVRATNQNYETATASATLRIEPAAVTVRANNVSKQFGAEEPEYTATVTGVIDGFEIQYTITRPSAGRYEDVGTYSDAIVPTGPARQGNYTVTYEAADFTVTPSTALNVLVEGYSGVYDGEPHGVTASASVTYGTTIEYSTDGGATWTTTPPTLRDVGELTVTVRATNPGFVTATQTVTITLTRRTVTVTADPVSFTEGEEEPEYTATVENLVEGDSITYTVVRANPDDTAPGIYENAIVPVGEEIQGNFTVTYVAADLEILEAEQPPVVVPPDTESPVTNPPDTQPPVTETPDTEPPVTEPPVTGTPDTEPPVTNPPVTQPPVTQPPVTQPPVTQPPVTQPPVTQPPVTQPPDTEPPVTNPPDTEPPETTGRIGEEIGDNDTPLTRFFDRFTPTGSTYGRNAWALVNLICVIVAIYVLLPLMHLKAKFGRAKMMRRVNDAKKNLRTAEKLAEKEQRERDRIERLALENRRKAGEDADPNANPADPNAKPTDTPKTPDDKPDPNDPKAAKTVGLSDALRAIVTDEEFSDAVDALYYQVKKFIRRFRIGLLIEVIDVILAVLTFIWTENLRTPMVLIDRWTPLMILFFAICWFVDVRLARYRGEVLAEEEEEELEQQTQELKEQIEQQKKENREASRALKKAQREADKAGGADAPKPPTDPTSGAT